jgi:hypothetical protein
MHRLAGRMVCKGATGVLLSEMHDTTLGQDLLDIMEAEREAQVHPGGSPDDITQEDVAGVRERIHAVPLRRSIDLGKPAVQLT